MVYTFQMRSTAAQNGSALGLESRQVRGRGGVGPKVVGRDPASLLVGLLGCPGPAS